MYKDKFTELRMGLAKELRENKDNNIKEGIFYYILFGTFTNPKFKDLPDDQEKAMPSFLQMISDRFVNNLEDILKDGVPEEFDLFVLCSQSVTAILEANEVKGDSTLITDLLLTAFAATFRMWYDKVTNDDIIAFLEEKEHHELPDMADSSITFAWAMEQHIPCSDMRSLFEYRKGDSLTADEEIGAYKAMGDMCKMFDTLKEVIVASGVPVKFIDDNLHTCRDIFMIAQLFFHMMPLSIDAEKLLQDSKRLDLIYDSFLKTMAGPEILKQIGGEENKPYYRKIFIWGFFISHVLDSKNLDKRSNLYEEVTKGMAKNFTDKE